MTNFKNFLFLFFFKRINSKIFKKIFNNPLAFYQHFSFRLVKLLVSLKVYKLYNRKYKKKTFDVKIIKKLLATLKSLKIFNLNFFINFLVYYISWVKNKITKLVLKVKIKKNFNYFKENKKKFLSKKSLANLRLKFNLKIKQKKLKFFLKKPKTLNFFSSKLLKSKLKKNIKFFSLKPKKILNFFLPVNTSLKKGITKLALKKKFFLVNFKKKSLWFLLKKNIKILKHYKFKHFLLNLKFNYFTN
jgi:hypothetical protein